MESKGKFVWGHKIKKDEDQLCFKPEQLSKWNLNLWQAQVMSNEFMHFDTLAKRSAVHSKTYATLLSVSITEFESKFQD